MARPLTDAGIGVFEEEVEIRALALGLSPAHSPYLQIEPMIKIWLNHAFWKVFLFLEDPPLFAVSSSGYTTWV